MHPLLLAALFGLAGFVALAVGGELLVRGASGLAIAFSISPLVIGLTVVAFGTSAPELAVTLQAGFAGEPDMAIGNVVGSNIANVLLILGISASVAPLVISSQLLRYDVPIMIAVSVGLFVLGGDELIGRGDGLILFVSLLVYLGWLVRKSRTENRSVQREFAQEFAAEPRAGWRHIVVGVALVTLGLVFLGFGSRWLIRCAVDVARLIGISELVIGLTIVAIGTSLPEIVTSVVAALRGQRDIAVGNAVGSNLFNILCVLGLAGIILPSGVPVSPTALHFDIPVMIAVAMACLPIFFTGHVIDRWEGLLFLGYYVAYVTYLILEASHIATRTLAAVMLGFVIPLTVITLGVGVVRSARAARRTS